MSSLRLPCLFLLGTDRQEKKDTEKNIIIFVDVEYQLPDQTNKANLWRIKIFGSDDNWMENQLH